MTWMATSCIAVAAPTVSLTQPLDQQMQEAIAADNAGKVAYMLRELGFDPNFYLPNGDTPLVFAIRMDATVSVSAIEKLQDQRQGADHSWRDSLDACCH